MSMLISSDRELLMSVLPFWDRLTGEQQELLMLHTTAMCFKKGSFLHTKEVECIGVLVVKDGAFRAYMTSDDGREISLYRLKRHAVCVLSASCVLSTITFEVTIEAETDCEVLSISPQIFARLSAENVYVELFSYRIATERFSDVMWVLQQVLFTSFDRRLAAYLLDECAGQGTEVLPTTHEQIARNLGTAREMVTRMLKYFKEEGLVRLSRGRITILDKKRLLCYAAVDRTD